MLSFTQQGDIFPRHFLCDFFFSVRPGRLESIVEPRNPHLSQEAAIFVALKPHLRRIVPPSQWAAKKQPDLVSAILFNSDHVLLQRREGVFTRWICLVVQAELKRHVDPNGRTLSESWHCKQSQQQHRAHYDLSHRVSF